MEKHPEGESTWLKKKGAAFKIVNARELKVKSRNEKLKIVIIGSRGIPCTYGGFETFAERLAVELVESGHSVTVYGQYDEGKKKGGITI